MSVTKQKLENMLNNKAVQSIVINLQGSKLFIKTLIPAAMASILYQRTNLNRNDFEMCQRNGIKFQIFKNQINNLTLREIYYWIKGALHAFDNNYLRQLYFIFTKVDDPTEVIESFKFQFKYMGDDGIHLDSALTEDIIDDINKSTDELFKSIGVFDTYESLQENEFIPIILLTYFDDVTPKDYEPLHFGKRNALSSALLNNVSNGQKTFIPLGRIETGFHLVKCRGKSNNFVIPPESSLSVTSYGTKDSNVVSPQEHINALEIAAPVETDDKDADVLNTTLKSIDSNSIIVISDEDGSSASVDGIDCPCGITSKFNNIELIECLSCLSLHHTPCLGHLYSTTVPKRYRCEGSTQNLLLNPSQLIKKQINRIVRLAAAYAFFNNVVPHDVLCLAYPEYIDTVKDKLLNCGIVKSDRCGYSLDVRVLESKVLEDLFIHTMETNRILADSSNLQYEKDYDAGSVILSAPKRKRTSV